MEKTDKHQVGFSITEFNQAPEDLTQILNLQPTKMALKGQNYFVGPPNKKIEKSWPWNFWQYQEVIENNSLWIGDQIDEFVLKTILPRKSVLNKLKSTCKFEFAIVQYIYHGCNPGYHFDNKILKILAEINFEIDIDTYVLTS